MNEINANKQEFSDNLGSYLKENYNFKRPIEYNDQTRLLDENIMNTLEMVNSIDKTEIPIYENIFLTNDYPSKLTMNHIAKHYTTDIHYLKQTQQLVKNIDKNKIIYDSNIDLALKKYEEIKRENAFYEKYFYLDFDFIKELNKNPHIMTCTSIYNMMSPIVSLCTPILILILPFIIIKLQQNDFNFDTYTTILKTLVAKTSIGSLFMNYSNSTDTKKIYLIVSTILYCFSIYQNILNCIRFYSNFKKIHDYLLTFKTYMKNTIENMKYFYSLTKSLPTYNTFTNELQNKQKQLTLIYTNFENITPFNINYNKLTEIGNIMSTFYKLFVEHHIDEVLLYSFGFNGYLYNMININEHVINNKLHKAK